MENKWPYGTMVVKPLHKRAPATVVVYQPQDHVPYFHLVS